MIPGLIFAFSFSLLFFVCAIVIHLFYKYRINYIYIFDMDPDNMDLSVMLYKIGFTMLASCLFLTNIQIIATKFSNFMEYPVAFAALIAVLMIILFLVSPFNHCYRLKRKEIWKAVFMVIISPFGQVKFRHFFLADIFTSLG